MKLTSSQHNNIPAGFIVLHNKIIKMSFFLYSERLEVKSYQIAQRWNNEEVATF